MAIVSPNDLHIGDTIRFRSLSPHDNVTWEGKISSVCDYVIARNFDDIDQYYQDVKREQRDMSAKELLTYLLLEIQENNTQQRIRAFAVDWIDTSTLERVLEDNNVDIRIYGIDPAKVDDVLMMLQAHGYSAEKITSQN